MTSINTNLAATTALRTLQSTNMQLESTQSRISTGLKIGEAKDNAAYWSISTSLQSDNKAMGTVKDALGLGAATIDTAYQGLNAAKDVLDEIKSKLTAATQPGVDKNVIQAEIVELQNQLESIANSSIFSGENWLSVDSDAAGYADMKKIVASFTRDVTNAVSIGTVNVDIGGVALFDSSTVAGKNGILDTAVGLKTADGRDLKIGGTDALGGNALLTGGLSTDDVAEVGVGAAPVVGTAGSPAGASSSSIAYSAIAEGGTGAAPADTITITITPSTGVATTTTFVRGAAEPTLEEYETAINLASATLGVTADIDDDGNLLLTSTTAGATVTQALTVSSSQATATYTPTSTGAAVAGSPTGVPASFGSLTTGTAIDLSGFTIGDKLTFNFNVNGNVVSEEVVLTSLDVSDLATALDTALTGSLDVAETAADSDLLRFTVTAGSAGATSTVSLQSVTATDEDDVAKIPSAESNLPISSAASTATSTFVEFTLDTDDNIFFDVKVDNATAAKSVKIDMALVNEALSVAGTPVIDGTVSTAAEYKMVLDLAFQKAGVTGLTVTAGADSVNIASNTVGAASKLEISNVAASAGADTISVDKIDISDAALATAGATTGDDIRDVLSAYVTVVNEAINKVTTAASNLGAVASRIELQQTFVTNLMDTIDKGVSGLIDADMNEESTRLQALQVKQQLGVQALSIANQSAQNVLSLFQ